MANNDATSELLRLLGGQQGGGTPSPGDLSQQVLAVVTPVGGETGNTGSKTDDSTTSSTATGPLNTLGDQLAQITTQLAQLQAANQDQINSTNDNTKAVTENTVTKAQGSGVGSAIGSVFSSIFGSAFGLSPIISGIASLFGGGDSSTPAPLVPYASPLSVEMQGGVTASAPGAVYPVDYSQGDQLRVAAPEPAAAPQITVQVQAMDSQSFLDHSQDIARAVRQAMLESGALGDVLREM